MPLLQGQLHSWSIKLTVQLLDRLRACLALGQHGFQLRFFKRGAKPCSQTRGGCNDVLVSPTVDFRGLSGQRESDSPAQLAKPKASRTTCHDGMYSSLAVAGGARLSINSITY